MTASATKRPGVAKRVPKEANLVLETHMRELGLSFCSEYGFAMPYRNWRFDYVAGPVGALLPQDRGKVVAIEIEGGVRGHYDKWGRWSSEKGGRHTRGSGYSKDLEKYRMAAALGYKVFRFSTQEVLDGTAKEFLARWA